MYPKFSRVVYPLFVFISLVIFVLMLIPNRQDASTIGTNRQRRYPVKNPDEIIPLEKEVEYRGDYIVFRNYVPADRQFKYGESVTLSVPADYRFLDNILPLVERWKGPISVALYAPGFDFFSTLQSIAFLRACSPKQMVKQFVTFHLFFEQKHMPKEDPENFSLAHNVLLQPSLSQGKINSSEPPLLDLYKDGFDCSRKPPFETVKDGDLYKEKMNLTYPINVARNVAKLAAQTHFVFPSDIELYPTRNFIREFLHFVEKRPEYFRPDSTNVFVLPLFEILEGYKIPETKKELRKMIRNETAFTFHQKVCKTCHKVPRVDEWIKDDDRKGLDVFTIAKRQNEQVIWEPFFVCTQKEPLWDERLNWEGQGNKMSQAYYLCMLDYDFIVLDNAFLIHKPGVKKKKVQNIKHKDQQAKNDRILKHIQEEIMKIYGKNDKCRIHNLFRN